MSPLSNLAARDVETLVHPYIDLASFRETGPLIFERAKGVYVYDTDGKPYIEMEDDHFPAPGAVGVWTKADSVTLFDDFGYGTLANR